MSKFIGFIFFFLMGFLSHFGGVTRIENRKKKREKKLKNQGHRQTDVLVGHGWCVRCAPAKFFLERKPEKDRFVQSKSNFLSPTPFLTHII